MRGEGCPSRGCRQGCACSLSRIACVLKTNEGGLWAVPQLAELRRRGHEVLVVIPSGPGRLRRTLEQENFQVIDSPFDFQFRPSWRLLRGLWRLRRVLVSLDVDVAFYHLYASALAVRLSTPLLGVRRVHMVAGPLYLDSTPIRGVERILCRLDDVLIAGSEHTAGRYAALGMPRRRLHAIPYGVDVDEFTPVADRRRELLGISSDTFVAIMVAYVYAPKSAVHRGVGIKGHEVLLEGMGAVRDRT